MSIVINGTGSISGLAVGGLPDGTVDDGTVASGIASSKLTGALPAISGAALTNTGKVLQVVGTSTTTSTYSSSSSFVDIAGAAATITPSSTSSKILVSCSIAGKKHRSSGIVYTGFRLLRGATVVWERTQHGASESLGWSTQSFDAQYLDSPATTSAAVYKFQFSTDGSDVSTGTGTNKMLSVTLMEIGV